MNKPEFRTVTVSVSFNSSDRVVDIHAQIKAALARLPADAKIQVVEHLTFDVAAINNHRRNLRKARMMKVTHA